MKQFVKVIRDFSIKLFDVFPEFKEKVEPYHLQIVEKNETKEDIENMFSFCSNIYPSHFFNIMYKNNDLFSENEEMYFLPNINFVELWKLDVKQSTYDNIWKYLQLVLFCIVDTNDNKSLFDNVQTLFENVNQKEFKKRMEATLESIKTSFPKQSENGENVENEESEFSFDDMSSKLDEVFNSKIGKLAKEIAEDTIGDLELDESMKEPGDVLKKMMSHPDKLMNIVQNIGSKIDGKVKSGEMKESELLEEALKMMSTFKNMPGAEGMSDLFTKMGMPAGAAKNKHSRNNVSEQIKKRSSQVKTKERLQKKLEERKGKMQDKTLFDYDTMNSMLENIKTLKEKNNE